MTELNIMTQVAEYLEVTEGWFNLTDLYQALNAFGDTKKQAAIRKSLSTLTKTETIERYGTRDGVYRRPNKNMRRMSFANTKSTNFPIIWPLDLHSLCRMKPKNIAIIAGEFDSGKTAFLLATANLNLNQGKKIYLFNSDCDDDELAERLSYFGRPMWEWEEGMEAYEKDQDFHDVIRPDAINIIDYLKITDNFYLVASLINKIWQKLDKGIAIISLQKDDGKDLGRGGTFSAEQARVYLTLKKNFPHGGIAKVMKGKLRANKHINPDMMQRGFKLVEGCKFIPQEEWSRSGEIKEEKEENRWS